MVQLFENNMKPDKSITQTAKKIRSNIENNRQAIIEMLIKYQPEYVTQYEIERCIYTLQNIAKIQNNLEKKQNIKVASLLPANLPLYSMFLFVMLPAFMVNQVAFRPASVLAKYFAVKDLFTILNQGIFGNITLFLEGSQKFVEDHISKSDLIIFLGSNATRKIIKEHMKPGSYMLNNGSGHNPIVISDQEVDLQSAVENVVYAKFFNDGQDCAGPDAVFMNANIQETFMALLKKVISDLEGKELVLNNHKLHIGKIHKESEIERLEQIINNYKNQNKIILGGKVDKERKIVYPTVILQDFKKENLNYDEVFGPILFLYPYTSDDQLKMYFKSHLYQEHKMYISLFGKNTYIENFHDHVLLQKKNSHKNGVGILLKDRILHDLEADNGTIPYGGFGENASSVIYKKNDGTFETSPKPLLVPQIIYELFEHDLFQHRISKEFVSGVSKIFSKKELDFAFIFGSVAKNEFDFHKSDVNTFICVNSAETQKQREKLKEFMISFQLNNNFKPNYDYPCEVFSRDKILELLYQMRFRVFEAALAKQDKNNNENEWDIDSCMKRNIYHWIDNGKLDCSFLNNLECKDPETFDAIFIAAVISSDIMFSEIVKDQKTFKYVHNLSKLIVDNVVKMIVAKVRESDVGSLPSHLKRKCHGETGGDVAGKLVKLDDPCEILRWAVIFPDTQF